MGLWISFKCGGKGVEGKEEDNSFCKLDIINYLWDHLYESSPPVPFPISISGYKQLVLWFFYCSFLKFSSRLTESSAHIIHFSFNSLISKHKDSKALAKKQRIRNTCNHLLSYFYDAFQILFFRTRLPSTETAVIYLFSYPLLWGHVVSPWIQPKDQTNKSMLQIITFVRMNSSPLFPTAPYSCAVSQYLLSSTISTP